MPEQAEAPMEIKVPARVTRYHALARRFREQTDRHQFSRAQLPRVCRIIHAVATEAERRGWTVDLARHQELSTYEAQRRRNAKEGHITIGCPEEAHAIVLTEGGVMLRGSWEATREWERGYPSSYRKSQLPRSYDAGGNGRIDLALVSGWKRDGRQSKWGDRQRWRLEDRLPQLFKEIDIRNAEAEEHRLERERRERDKQTQWEEAMARARKRFARSHRAQILKADMAAFREAQELREHADRLEQRLLAHGEERESVTQWIAWVREYAHELDPVASLRGMPETPEPRHEDLRPFLGGLSPYGPT